VEIIEMPSMSNSCFSYFAPLASCDEDVWAYRENVHAHVTDFDSECANVGLKRGLHYSLTPLSKPDIAHIIEADGHHYPSNVPIFEVRFRSKKHLQAASAAGILKEAEGVEAEKPIWG
jgi:hypothetical protein